MCTLNKKELKNVGEPTIKITLELHIITERLQLNKLSLNIEKYIERCNIIQIIWNWVAAILDFSTAGERVMKISRLYNPESTLVKRIADD